MVIEWPKSFAEDSFFELRAGPALMRNVGPTLRCNDIRVNYEKLEFVKKREPYSTLASFRTNPGVGICFGMYY